MPSPFPGMDPFLEDQVWSEFHDKYISAIQDALVPVLRPRYVARMGERVYLHYEPHQSRAPVRPDVTVLRETSPARGGPRGGAAVISEPIMLTLPAPEEIKESFLEVRLRETHEVVAVIEVLSPTNKRGGADGQGEYLVKREAVIRSRTHLVEIDLLRGGERMPMEESVPPCDFLVLVGRGDCRPLAEVRLLGLRDRLPVIPIPLLESDPDAPLDLQEVFDTVYDRAGYDYSIDYNAPVKPPLTAEEQEWVASVLAQREVGNEEMGK